MAVGDLFEGYLASLESSSRIGRSYDEVFDTKGGSVRALRRRRLGRLGDELRRRGVRASRLARAFMDQGVTFDLDGEERPFPLDVVPRIFTVTNGTTSQMASHNG